VEGALGGRNLRKPNGGETFSFEIRPRETTVSLKTKRVYDRPQKGDGYRILVDRLWPRGVKKERAAINEWLKEIAPSDDLRKWFGHDPSRWQEFERRYFEELREKVELVDRIRKEAESRPTVSFFVRREGP
jgi:uncharacterized protein YeaO (DUF488 family)